MKVLAGLGVGTSVFHRALAAQAQNGDRVTAEMVQQAEWISGIELDDEQRESTARSLNQALDSLEQLRAVELDYDVAPALKFDPAPDGLPDCDRPNRNIQLTENSAPERPKSDETLAFLPVTELAALMRTRQISSVQLTQIYIERLRRYGERLKCLVTLTEGLAMQQAARADQELAAGKYRGPLHGIPWGAKDLIAHPGYATAWGAEPFRDQMLNVKATVAERLEQAGAVLVAKLSLGALAQGDRWYEGMTRNPWNPREGSSGSSAGSASATAAGLVGFALGSETLGSIVSPCRRCGTTGLRPTFGRVSRHGCMSLAWSMDKLGPITRSVEDCAVVLAAIHGADGLDATAVNQPFSWPAQKDLRSLKVGYFEQDSSAGDRDDLRVLGDLGVQLVPIKLPTDFPVRAMTVILTVEAAAVFDPLTREGVTEGIGRWPRRFRLGEFIPAVEYLRANRIRSLLIQKMAQVMAEVDAYVGGDDLTLTNLTGHPTVVLRSGFEERNGVETPRSITMTGRLYGETNLLALAHAYQQATGYHLRHPELDELLDAF